MTLPSEEVRLLAEGVRTPLEGSVSIAIPSSVSSVTASKSSSSSSIGSVGSSSSSCMGSSEKFLMDCGGELEGALNEKADLDGPGVGEREAHIEVL